VANVKSAKPAGMGRLLGMNGLRGVAALSVLITHVRVFGTPDPRHHFVNGGGTLDAGLLNPIFVLLGFGVPLFFSVSGFLLYRRFAAAIVVPRTRPNITEYARARVLRIVPPYWAILFVTGVLVPAALIRTPGLALGDLTHHPRELLADFALVQNYIPSTTITGIGPTWTLLNETIFYLVLPALSLPLIAVAARTAAWHRRLALAFVAPVVLLTIGLASKCYGALALGLTPDGGWDANWATVFQRSFLYQADLFAAGMSVAVLSVLAELGTLRLSWRLRRTLLAVAAAVFVTVPFLARHGLYPGTFVDTAVTIPCGLLLFGLATVGDRRSWLASALNWQPIAFVGLASYSLFLWHEPVVRWLNAHDATFAGRAGLAANIALVAAIALVLSALSYRLIERPCLAFRKRLDANRRARAAAHPVQMAADQ
jgi:peptidoglycan/LPS O-acetylase OafA/YrhL